MLRSILRDEKGRYSHYFQYPPSLNKDTSMEKTPSTEVSCTAKELSPVRAHLLSDEDENEPQEEKELSAHEFLLAVDDLESVLCYNATNDRTYNLQSNIKKVEVRNLDQAYTEYEEKNQHTSAGKKRFKLSEQTEVSYPIYDNDDLYNHCENLDRITLCLKNREKVRYVSKAATKATKINFFENLSEELRHFSKVYARSIEEIHMLFMEVSCDLGNLHRLLEGRDSTLKWTELEDIAVQSNPESVEYSFICKQRGKEEVEKRRLFLEQS